MYDFGMFFRVLIGINLIIWALYFLNKKTPSRSLSEKVILNISILVLLYWTGLSFLSNSFKPAVNWVFVAVVLFIAIFYFFRLGCWKGISCLNRQKGKCC